MDYQFDAYLAGPFFTPQQVETMDKAKAICQGAGLTVFDPREHTPKIVDVPPAERTPMMLDAILKANVDGILSSLLVIACIDDRDTGTSWELGFAYARVVPTLTFSARGFGANVMIARSVRGHLQSLPDLSAYLNRPDVNIAIMSRFQTGNLPPVNLAETTE